MCTPTVIKDNLDIEDNIDLDLEALYDSELGDEEENENTSDL